LKMKLHYLFLFQVQHYQYKHYNLETIIYMLLHFLNYLLNCHKILVALNSVLI
jgi:hypothetical protein